MYDPRATQSPALMAKAETARDYRGSSDFKAAIDVAFHVTNFGDPGRLDKMVLRCFKSRYGLAGEIVYQYAGGRLLRADAGQAAESGTERLVMLLRSNPGTTAKDFEALASDRGLGRNRARTFLGDGIQAKTIRYQTGPRNTKHDFLADMNPQTEI